MGCVDFTAKYLLFCVNFFITLFSLGIIIVGVAVFFLVFAVDINLLFIPVVIVIVGGTMFMVSCFGCCGTIGETTCLLITYTICMVVAILATISLAVMFSGAAEGLSRSVELQLENALANPNARPIFMGLEGLLNCCGTTGPGSYQALNLTLPVTCCHTFSAGNVTIEDLQGIDDLSQINLCVEENAYTIGCSGPLLSVLEVALMVLFYLLISVIVIQAVGIITAAYLSYHFSTKGKLSKFSSVESIQQTHYINYNPRPNFNHQFSH